MLHKRTAREDRDDDIRPLYGRRVMDNPIPRFEIPDDEMGAAAAYQLIHDELLLDGNPVLNLASFVTTWMEPEAKLLMDEAISKNFIDQEEYPVTSVLERRCVSIIADLYHADATGDAAVGTSTIGSSEAIHLCGLAMKHKWRNRRQANGQDASKPNLVMSSAVHVTWEKFCRYFDVEPRMVPLTQGRYVVDPVAVGAQCDENTIGVVGILGSTYTGHFDPIDQLDEVVAGLNDANGWQIPVHVDAASGGFVAPFAYPDLAWDFRLPNVHSINVSGHKYGLVYPGVGWAIWRDADDLPEELIFHDSYLGNDQSTFDLNFSKSAAQVIGQYYNLIRLGRKGYTEIMQNMLSVADYLDGRLTEAENVTVISEQGNLPLVCVQMHDDAPFNAHDVSAHLRAKGWIVPAYNMPADLEAMSVLRVVVREGFTRDLVDRLVDDLLAVKAELLANPPKQPRPARHSKQRVC